MNSNSDDIFSFEVKSYHTPSRVKPSFALPLASRTGGGNALYIQDSDPQGRISGLAPLQDPLPTRDLKSPVLISVGDEAVHVIIGPHGEVRAGSRSELSDTAADWAKAVGYPLSRFSFLDFAGEYDRADRAARDLFAQKKSELGFAYGSEWFAEVIIFPRLLSLAFGMSAEENNNSLRLALATSIWTDQDRINIAMPTDLLKRVRELESNDSSLQVDRLRHIAKTVLGLQLNFANESLRPPPGRRSEAEISNSTITEWAHYINSLPRQEKRISQLLSVSCSKRHLAAHLVNRILPKTPLEKHVVSILKGITLSEVQDELLWDYEMESLVTKIHRETYPLRRAAMLYEIASDVRNNGAERAIKHVLRTSGSAEIDRYRAAIESKLD